MQLKFTVQNLATPRLQKLIGKLQKRQPLLSKLGKATEIELRRWFAQRNQEPNANGWPKGHFWARIRRATAFVGADNNTAVVSIADPAFAHKLTGGTIRPRAGRKNIAIPLTPEAKKTGNPSSGLLAGLHRTP
ncbi:MAG: hypothetical protein LBT53_08695 [Puniceicoccales bacterium]|jgi:hypothetical protein|nr:hypothetical protein [Puniceicoccales bacterium]